ncbi:head-tail connector protein [Kosakonia sacchari]|uniref:head-tail connector protein n=1 Tax=Kosakonia sacchari TaxID=1158459 RepID=UPI002ACDD438|nr:head-tail connector protein [Kosakonia sacchari]MDZ7322041.1 head-tail connector protein [Kosakonia sacchari]
MDITDDQLQQIKMHLRVDDGEEDALIKAYALAAISYVESYCDGKLVETLSIPVEGQPAPREILFNSGLWAAILLMVGHWYSNREAVNIGNITSEIPLGVESILFLQRRWR